MLNMIWSSVGTVKTVLSIFVFFLISFSDQKSIIAPESQKLHQDVVSGLGLYNDFKQITELTPSNFKDLIYSKESPKMWVVEFYNSWCGHCHRFAPIYKSLAVDIYNWRDVVGIGAVDCANDKNNQLCRDYEIMAYPSIKFFPVHSPDTFLGEPFMKGSVEEMKASIVKELELEQYSGYSKVNLNLKPYMEEDLHRLWFHVPVNVKYAFLVVQNESMGYNLGSEVALNFLPVKDVIARTVYSSNKGLKLTLSFTNIPNVYAVDRKNNNVENLQLEVGTVPAISEKIVNFLKTRGVDVTMENNKPQADVDFDIDEARRVMETLEDIRKKLHKKDLSDVIFQVDLENALQYSLYHEIGNKKLIDGEKMDTLKNYLTVLEKYFPIGVEGRKFLSNLRNDVINRNSFAGKNFTLLAKQYQNKTNSPFLSKQDWLGCKGSQAHFRGYPCGLWTLFHTLTVHADVKQSLYPDADPKEVLNAMIGYIKNFFGCTDCSQHFQAMGVTMAGNVSNFEDSILWLWKSHNAANQRLAGDLTEDPEHRKVQFPSAQACPLCRDSNGDWHFPEVVKFLRSMYVNISYIQWSDLAMPASISTERSPAETSYSKRLRHEIVESDNNYLTHSNSTTNKSTWDFNVFDISLCVVLYASSVIILLLVCIKFIVRKGYRKKPYPYDVAHGKV